VQSPFNEAVAFINRQPFAATKLLFTAGTRAVDDDLENIRNSR